MLIAFILPVQSINTAAKVDIPESPSTFQTMAIEVTAYSHGCGSGCGLTYTGTEPRRGVCAVDPEVIPLGTEMYIPGYGWAIAEDTGGAVNGNMVDVFMETRQEAVEWGRKNLNIEILKGEIEMEGHLKRFFQHKTYKRDVGYLVYTNEDPEFATCAVVEDSDGKRTLVDLGDIDWEDYDEFLELVVEKYEGRSTLRVLKADYLGGQSRYGQEAVDYLLVKLNDGTELYAECPPGKEIETYDFLYEQILEQAKEKGIDTKDIAFKILIFRE